MLKSLDILIGLSVVMFVVSMAVTLVTQAMITITGRRGRHLLAGLVDLLDQLDPALGRKHAGEIAKTILKNPAINGGTLFGVARYGEVIHREELTKMLLELAMKANASGHVPGDRNAEALKVLKKVLAANGIADPQQTLDKVRMLALHLEKTHPELACNARQSMALLHHASSQFLAKINLRFDAVIDRVSERFTFDARIMTFLSAALVAVALQLDTITLANRLAMDEATRSAFVQAAIDTQAKSIENGSPMTASDLYASLASEGIFTVPRVGEWMDHWQNVNLAGVGVSILLLSLGAPFWYGALARLLQLRSLLAQKDDTQRSIRQTTQATGASSSQAILVTSSNGRLGGLPMDDAVAGPEFNAGKPDDSAETGK